jgi:hypothetical protein
VIYVPDHENVRRCGGIAAVSPNLGTSGSLGRGGGAISILPREEVHGHSPTKKNVPFPRNRSLVVKPIA